MKSTIDRLRRLRSLHLLCAAAGAYALITSAGAAAQGKPAAAPAAAQKTFATAQEAADALVSAAESFDRPTLKAILGPDADYLVAPGEPAKDRETAMAFAAKAREKMDVVTDPKNPNRATLIVGDLDVTNSSGSMKVTVFRADPGIVQSRGNRVGIAHLAGIIL